MPQLSTDSYPLTSPWVLEEALLPCPSQRSDVSLQILDDEALLFDSATGGTFRLNRTALIVWEGCQPTRTYSDLVDDVCNEYEIDRATASDHVQQMVAMLANNGLLNP